MIISYGRGKVKPSAVVFMSCSANFFIFPLDISIVWCYHNIKVWCYHIKTRSEV